MNIQKTLYDHKKWLTGEPGGVRADLRNADLHGADLSYADLRNADLHGADLSYADLRRADLLGADLHHANLNSIDLRSADLRSADLSFVNLNGANLNGADLRDADLSNADLNDASLNDADLSGADLSGADLSGADLSGADLRRANLCLADLSGAKGLLNPAVWLAENFESDGLGYIVYKAVNYTDHKPPKHWRIEPGAFLEEVPNPLPMDEYGCGVNFATFDWVRKHYSNSTIWRCRIRWADLPLVVVPYNTDGKARCGRLELLEVVA